MGIIKLLGGELPKGALFMCLAEYPQFKADFDILHKYGYVKITNDTTLEWAKTQVSLAEYFKWIGAPHPVTSGFWGPVSKCFGIGQRALSKAASNNANPLKPEYSKDFLKIKKILEEYRAKTRIIQKEQQLFRKVKKLVLEAKDEEPGKIHEILSQIAGLFPKNVDKNVQKRR
jgi:hypothetical protein